MFIKQSRFTPIIAMAPLLLSLSSSRVIAQTEIEAAPQRQLEAAGRHSIRAHNMKASVMAWVLDPKHCAGPAWFQSSRKGDADFVPALGATEQGFTPAQSVRCLIPGLVCCGVDTVRAQWGRTPPVPMPGARPPHREEPSRKTESQKRIVVIDSEVLLAVKQLEQKRKLLVQKQGTASARVRALDAQINQLRSRSRITVLDPSRRGLTPQRQVPVKPPRRKGFQLLARH